MKLTEFRIRNFRSINDSGVIRASDRTALLGRNESGKTNLLLGLSTLNPPTGYTALDPVKNFPRHLDLNDCTDDTEVVDTKWTLSDAERQELAKVWPRGGSVTTLNISRAYGGESREIFFEGHKPLKLDAKQVTTSVGKLAAIPNTAIQQAVATIPATDKPREWAAATTAALKTVRETVKTAQVVLNGGEKAVSDLELLATAVLKDGQEVVAARKWVSEQLPTFILVDEYPDMSGHMDIAQLILRRRENRATGADTNFMKLLKVAGLNLDELNTLLTHNPEKRQLLANRASAMVTKKLRDRWKDRALLVRFILDAHHFDTIVSDPNSDYPVEVNLNERSRGLQWFFAFMITFMADTDGGPAADAVLLLDEPGLYLHAVAQRDLLNHFAKDFTNQIMFTTHSPFMVPVDDLGSVRTVNITQEGGTAVSNEPTGDARTLFPLQAALGYDVAQTLFLGKRHLLVEGVTDFWFLNAIGNHLQDLGKPTIPKEAVITPCGAASKIPYMVSLLGSDKLPLVALFDGDKEGRTISKELLKMKLLDERAIMLVSEALGDAEREADIEDLIDPATYEALVKECYATELKGKAIKPNMNIPRIAVRMEKAFDELGLAFHKTRPANLFIRRMGEKPETVLKGDTLANFEKLFKLANAKLVKAHIPFKA